MIEMLGKNLRLRACFLEICEERLNFSGDFPVKGHIIQF